MAGNSGDETSEGVVGGGEDAGDVLPNNERWIDGIDGLHKGEGEVAARIGEGFAPPGDGERLAGRTADDHVAAAAIPAPIVRGHVADVGHIRVVVRENGGRERLDLRKANRLPAQRPRRHARALDAGEKRDVFHNDRFFIARKTIR